MTVTRRDLAQALKEEHGGTISGHDEWIKKFIDVLSRKISIEMLVDCATARAGGREMG